MSHDVSKSYEMFKEVQDYVPGGVNFPRTPLFLTYGVHPAFIQRTKGARFWDVDGNEYIDYMCSFGAVGIGYNHPAVDEAYNKQLALSNSSTLPSFQWLEFAKFLVGEIPYMDWTVYGKNGSDATTFAAMAARAHTGKNGIVMANNSYHGLHNWCIHSDVGIPAEYKSHVYHYDYHDLEGLGKLMEEKKDEIAAVFLLPLGHWAMMNQTEPQPGYFETVREICDKAGALMLIDDVRAGFRVHYEGTHCHYGKANPDIICFGKTIANGYPLSVAMGTKAIMESAKKVYWSGTHFYSAAPMAAARACMTEIKASGAIEKIRLFGEKLQAGLREQAKLHEVEVTVSGHPAMPYMLFGEDPSLEKMRFFCGEAAKRGIFLHPHHNWFISSSLTEEDMDKTLEVTDQCFKIVAEQKG